MAGNTNDNHMSHDGAFHLVCTCFQLPPDGTFTIGREYTFGYIIDAEKVVDDLGQVITFPEKVFKSCFYNFGDNITPFDDPMLHDKTIYHVYFILGEGHFDLEAVKAYSKLMNVNYIQAWRILNDKRILVATGNAYDIRELFNKLIPFQVHYEISPPYPYQL